MMSIDRRKFLYALGIASLAPSGRAGSKLLSTPVDHIDRLDRFCFGSCNRHFLDQPLWKRIAAEQPDLFIWGGDSVYCDTEDPKLMKDIYLQQSSRADYKEFASKVPIIGTWDDHDYGQNNAGENNPIKHQAQKNFLSFINEPFLSSRRFQEGVYTSYNIGNDDQKVKIILLDIRFHKNEGQLLSEIQWNWLENELRHSDAKINIIVSSIPIAAPVAIKVEHWKRAQSEYNRLVNIIDDTRPSGLFFLTGDQHIAAVFKDRTPWGIPLQEAMSSGLTHHAKKIIKPYLNSLYGRGNFFIDQNYGILEIIWSTDPQIVLTLKSLSGKYEIRRTYKVIQGLTYRF